MKHHTAELCLAACLLSLSPLLFFEIQNLWERPHFQFFPLAWGALIALIVQRAETQWNTRPTRQRFGYLSWMLGMAIGVVAAIFFSPWISQLAAIFCVTGWGLLRLPTVPVSRWLGWTLLLWITLPLPGKLDMQFINELQRISSASAGALLDLMGVAHLRQGTLIEIQSRQLFVDEACSGVDSLYSLIAIAMLLLLWLERPLIVGACTLLTVPLWAWLGNVTRLTLIVSLLDRYGFDLSEGWKHTALGFCTFAMSSLCLLATLDAFSHMFRRFSLNDIPRDNGTWYRWYNLVVCYPGKSPVVSGDSGNFAASPEPRSSRKKERRPSRPPRLVSFLLLNMVTLAILGLSVAGIAREKSGRFLPVPHYTVQQVNNAFTEPVLPETLAGATRVSFRGEDRTPDNFFGEYSRIWLYRAPIGELIYSIDFPFRGFHALWICYTNSGKEVIGSPVAISSPALQTNSGGAAIQRVALRDELGSYSYLWFTLFDETGKALEVEGQGYMRSRIMHGLNRAFEGLLAPDPVTYQFQMLVNSGREMTDQELDEHVKNFELALPNVQSQVKALASSPK